MRFADIENVWTADVSLLSNADRGRVYFERAKQVVAEALADPTERSKAVDRTRFRRSYLIEKIGCQPAVTTQNPKIRALLSNTDRGLFQEARQFSASSPLPGRQVAEIGELRAIIDALRYQVQAQQSEIVDLRRKLREAGWVEAEPAGPGCLPW